MTPFLTTAQERIEETLKKIEFTKPEELHASLFEAASYSLFSKGKRLRPLLTLAATQDLRGSVEAALIPACALELIHTYSLIHDDLPCMDDDDIRRGKPSLHRAFDEGIAVLAGDYFLTKAFELLSVAPDLSAEQKLELVKIVAVASGGDGMIGGQVVDLSLDPQEASTDELSWINAKKTGALFIAALEIGAVVSGCDPKDRVALRSVGHHFGLAFQLLDDLEDSSTPPSDEELQREIAATWDALSTLSHLPFELKALIKTIYEHIETPL